MLSGASQKQLQEFLKRRHPEYENRIKHWNFLEATYEGSRDWFKANIHKYLKEGRKEFNDRVARAYRFNHTREIVELVQKYLFKGDVVRKDDAPDYVKTFWKASTRSNLNIDQFIRLVSSTTSQLGRCAVFVDSTKTDATLTKADEKKAGARVYAYIVKPQNILDYGFDDDDGELLWILVAETYRDDKDPITATGKVKVRYRLWTRTNWYLFEVNTTRGGNARVDQTGDGEVAIGRVPCFFADHLIGENLYWAPGLIDEIAYLDRATANYLSNLDAIIQDQTFSQLAMPAQSVLPGEKGYDALIEAGTKRTFLYDSEGGEPKFLSPDPKQAQLIITVINKIIAEIYQTAGASGERTKQDNAVGIDNSSGVAKAYDFDKLNSLLTSKAQSLQQVENKIVELVALWTGETPPEENLVSYPETFDVRSLFDEFTVAQNLALMDAPQTVRAEQMKQVIEKLFPGIAKAIKDKMLDELKDWPKDPIEQARLMFNATSPAAGAEGESLTASRSNAPPTASKTSGQSDTKKTSTKGRQGQVTDKTQKKTAA
ncbi:hypothetical protein [Methylobacterium oryzae]|uniref:hypothetical protein n=1 Tax=Methylobacterium oryzae TaxID=334852 RepID=UPI001F37B7C7|nr:hypothetical protein [Methylobacterium oryzae]UIN38274.1 hypothetical protein LXM90_31055 [Methylobacterium oryzae]